MDNKIRVLVKEIRNGLLSNKTKDEIEKWLQVSNAILTTSDSGCEASASSAEKILGSFGWEPDQVYALKSRILKQHARRLIECIISLLTAEWLNELTPQRFDVLVKPIFLQSVSQDAFVCLFEAICVHDRKDFLFHKLVSLLESMMTRPRLYQLLERHTHCTGDTSTNSVLTADADTLVASLASLPEKMANRLQQENSDAFLPQHYIPVLALSIYDCLCSAHGALSNSRDISLLMVSRLVGKLCLVGYADLLLDTLLPYLCLKVRCDFLWCRICERIFSSMPARNLEPVVTALLKKLPWYGLTDKFLGECVVNNIGIRNLVCVKLLLHKYYPQPRQLLTNTIGYLSSCPSRRHLYREVFVELLRVWGDKSSMKHISNQQHVYISKALMLCTSLLDKEERETYKSDLLRILMPGVQTHLESNNHDMRMVGMCVAQRLIATVDPGGPQLEFEVDADNPQIKDLLTYQGLPQDPGLSEAEKLIQSANTERNENGTSENEDGALEKKLDSLNMSNNSDHHEDEELDSDDDLTPYDMSNDKKVTEAKPPKYIRDCMEGVIYMTENPARADLCLEHAEGLIRKHTDGLDEIAVEFAKILLHLNDTHSFDKFLLHRFSALVALTVACPVEVADYLASQFYERNYNTRQRLDVLEVLANAAQELSQPKSSKMSNESHNTPSNSEKITPSSQPSSWREVVQKRIDSNTRRFARGRTQPLPAPTQSRFAGVAGHFFFPLMTRVDQSGPCLDLLGKDTLLLYRLLYTLAIVLHSATNLVTAMPMGRSLLEFTWPLRSHSDSSVRQAVVICTSTVFLVVPTFQLMADLHAEVTEVKSWLEDVFEKDPDAECQKMAAQALLLLDEQIKKEVTKEIPT